MHKNPRKKKLLWIIYVMFTFTENVFTHISYAFAFEYLSWISASVAADTENVSIKLSMNLILLLLQGVSIFYVNVTLVWSQFCVLSHWNKCTGNEVSQTKIALEKFRWEGPNFLSNYVGVFQNWNWNAWLKFCESVG